MKKNYLYIIVTFLYLLTPVCIFGVLGTMVSLKYEVDEARIFADINFEPTDKEKSILNKRIDEREQVLNRTLNLWTLGLIAFPLTATGLLVCKKRLLVKQSST